MHLAMEVIFLRSPEHPRSDASAVFCLFSLPPLSSVPHLSDGTLERPAQRLLISLISELGIKIAAQQCTVHCPSMVSSYVPKKGTLHSGSQSTNRYEVSLGTQVWTKLEIKATVRMAMNALSPGARFLGEMEVQGQPGHKVVSTKRWWERYTPQY